jgi:hypothetical protein
MRLVIALKKAVLLEIQMPKIATQVAQLFNGLADLEVSDVSDVSVLGERFRQRRQNSGDPNVPGEGTLNLPGGGTMRYDEKSGWI